MYLFMKYDIKIAKQNKIIITYRSEQIVLLSIPKLPTPVCQAYDIL